MRAHLLALALLLLAGCSRQAEDTHLLNEVKRRLSERDARLTSYRLEGSTREAGTEAVSFSFAYRAPQRMRGTLGGAQPHTFSWDGEHLFEQSDADKHFTLFKNELSPERRAGFLTETFAPFSPEGFRAPLLPATLHAKRTTHPRAPEAVELTGKVEDASSGGLLVSYTLRWPTLDFLGRQTRLASSKPLEGSAMLEVRVEEEHCDEGLKLCVPQKLSLWANGQQAGQTVLSRVELNPALPNDTFTLTAPEGYEAQTKTLVDTAGK